MGQHKESLSELHTHALSCLTAQEQQADQLESSTFMTHAAVPGESSAASQAAQQSSWWQRRKGKTAVKPQGKDHLKRCHQQVFSYLHLPTFLCISDARRAPTCCNHFVGLSRHGFSAWDWLCIGHKLCTFGQC